MLYALLTSQYFGTLASSNYKVVVDGAMFYCDQLGCDCGGGCPGRHSTSVALMVCHDTVGITGSCCRFFLYLIIP
jgi:hypothetical protein